MNTVLPLQSSNLGLVESAFVNPGGSRFGVSVGLGAVTRVRDGKCMQRHHGTGACWGTFDGEHTRFVDNRDHAVGCYVSENHVTAIRAGDIANPTNQATQFAGTNVPAAASLTQPSWSSPPTVGDAYGSVSGMGALCAGAQAGTRSPCQSYGIYSNCPNCSLTGRGASCSV